MIRMMAKTKLSPGEAIKRAAAFFGAGGYGLEITKQSADCICFAGGGGSIEVTAAEEAKGASVELVSQEWDFQVKEFLDTIT